jgi:opacity protein-like surface antigen
MLILASALALGGTAQAGEPESWAGWRAGAFGAFVSGKLNSNDPTHEQSTGDYKDSGPMAGIYTGYRHQSAGNLVVGVDLILPLYIFKGTATDKQYFPDKVFYEAKSRYGAMLGAQVGPAMGKALPYVFGVVGFANIDGRTLNVDENDQYSPGFVQSAKATHFVWQGGAGLDYQCGEKWLAGVRAGAFMGAQADHTMPWNEPGPNMFGYHAFKMEFNLSTKI